MHVIAGKAVAFGEALRPDYRVYMEHVVENCRTLGQGMTDGGLRLVSGGPPHGRFPPCARSR